MSITLCFDFGNTRKKVAVFNEEEIQQVIVLKDDSNETINELITKYGARKSILSSVVDHNAGIEEILAAKTKFHKLSHLTKLAFTSPVGKPETIGADRLALCAAAVHFYPKKNIFVIGMGTCVTYNLIKKYQ